MFIEVPPSLKEEVVHRSTEGVKCLEGARSFYSMFEEGGSGYAPEEVPLLLYWGSPQMWQSILSTDIFIGVKS